MIETKKIVVLNDLRAVPVIAALKIHRENAQSTLIASRRLFYNHEYADYTPLVWKLILMTILKVFFRLEIIQTNKSTRLEAAETMGLVSSLYSITNDSGANGIKYPQIYHEVEELALGSKEAVNYISSIGASLIYLFNGRTASSYLISKYCHEAGVDIAYYEYAWHCNGYRLYPVPPHASGEIGKLLIEFREQALISIPELRNNALLFAREKLNNEFAANNDRKVEKQYDVSIYLGSDHEYTAVDPEICNISWNGNIAFCKMVFAKYGNERIYAIRCHPNSYTDKNWPALFQELKQYASSAEVKIDLFGPDSNVDSHDLMRRSRIIVTELSSIAVDAVLLGMKVDIFGNTDLRVILEKLSREGHPRELRALDYIAEVFSLWPRFLVIRFNRIEKVCCIGLFYVHRFFDKCAARP